MAGHNKKGRSIKWEKHVRLEKYLFTSPAYRSLSPEGRGLFNEFKWRFNGQNNGEVHMSIRSAKKAINVGRKKAERGLWELQDRGFIKKNRPGMFTFREATTWILTCESWRDKKATKEFLYWEPEKQNEVLPRNTIRAPEEHQDKRRRNNINPLSAPHGHQNPEIQVGHGAPEVHTCSIPGTGVCSDLDRLIVKSLKSISFTL